MFLYELKPLYPTLNPSEFLSIGDLYIAPFFLIIIGAVCFFKEDNSVEILIWIIYKCCLEFLIPQTFEINVKVSVKKLLCNKLFLLLILQKKYNFDSKNFDSKNERKISLLEIFQKSKMHSHEKA